VLAPLVAKLEHCALDFPADLKTLGVGSFGCKDSGLDCAVDELGTLLGADLNESSFSGLLANDTPVSAGKVCLPGDLHLAAAAVAAPSVAGFFELVNGDALVAAFVLDDELALVDLFLVDDIGVNAVLVSDHPAGKDRADRSTTVDTDEEDVVKIDLLPLGKFVERHGIAALDRDTDLHVCGAVHVLLDELGQEQGTAVEGAGSVCQFFRIGDQDRLCICF